MFEEIVKCVGILSRYNKIDNNEGVKVGVIKQQRLDKRILLF